MNAMLAVPVIAGCENSCATQAHWRIVRSKANKTSFSPEAGIAGFFFVFFTPSSLILRVSRNFDASTEGLAATLAAVISPELERTRIFFKSWKAGVGFYPQLIHGLFTGLPTFIAGAFAFPVFLYLFFKLCI
jgi:hypothetical protein